MDSRPENVNLYNDTILTIFSQYNGYLTVFCFIFVLALVVNNNHALIQQRKKDIGTMKALGTLPRQIVGFYLTELLVLVSFSFLISIAIGSLLFLGIFIILEFTVPNTILQTNYSAIFIMFFIILGVTFLFNGFELYKLAGKSYGDMESGKIDENINAKLSNKWNKFLRKKSTAMKMAIKNLMRKKHDVKQKIVLIALSALVILTGIIGVIILDNTAKKFIQNAQKPNQIIVGSRDVLQTYQLGYQSFSNQDLNISGELELTKDQNSISSSTDVLGNFLSTYIPNTISEEDRNNFIDNSFENRIFTTYEIFEEYGWAISNSSTVIGDQYDIIGMGNRSRIVCIQGYEDVDVFENFTYVGNPEDPYRKAKVGDTLAEDVFSSALNQSLSIHTSNETAPYIYRISAVLVDTFNNGNSLYLPIDDVRSFLKKPDYTNLISIDFQALLDKNASISKEKFMDALNETLEQELGKDFYCIDLNPIFKNNMQSLNPFVFLTLSLSGVITLFVVYTMNQYQIGRIREDEKEIAILKAIGLDELSLKKSLFYENAAIVFLAFLIGFIISIFFLLFFLMQDVVLPSFIVPVSILLMMLCLIYFISYLSIDGIVKKTYRDSNIFMNNL